MVSEKRRRVTKLLHPLHLRLLYPCLARAEIMHLCPRQSPQGPTPFG